MSSDQPNPDPLATLVVPDLLRRALDPHDPAWRPFRTGVEILPIYQAPGGQSAALLRYQPGASVPHHEHPGYEHVLLLSGTQTDERGEHQAGSLVVNPPGSQHSVSSRTGCVVLVFWERPVAFTPL